jgi:hypothetical protein
MNPNAQTFYLPRDLLELCVSVQSKQLENPEVRASFPLPEDGDHPADGQQRARFPQSQQRDEWRCFDCAEAEALLIINFNILGRLRECGALLRP